MKQTHCNVVISTTNLNTKHYIITGHTVLKLIYFNIGYYTIIYCTKSNMVHSTIIDATILQ